MQSVALGRQVIKLAATNGVHRVWLVDLERNPVGLASLTDLLQILVDSCPEPPC